jgi:hypothetical protein
MTTPKLTPAPSPLVDIDVAASDRPGKTRLPPRPFLEVLREGRAPPFAAATGPPVASPPTDQRRHATPRPAAASLRALVTRAFAADRQMDVVLEAAARRRTFSAGELLAVQVQVFRYSQTVEVISRATDKLVGAVKQTLGTQV